MKTIIYIILLLTGLSLKAQDLHFSKYYDAPLILNPANTGNYSGNWRLINNYRQQGDKMSPYYTTTTIAFDHPIYIKKEKASIGIIYIHDNSSEFSFFTNKLLISSAYFLKVSQNSYLHMGLQAGIIYKSINNSKLTFPDQFDMNTGYFNSDLSTAESLTSESDTYSDMNTGLIWSMVQNNFKIEIGAGLFHFNTPSESFLNTDNNMKIKQLYHVYYQQKFLEYFYFQPIFIYATQNKANELLTGIKIGKKSSVSATDGFGAGVMFRGGFFRTQDALIAESFVCVKDFKIGISYDIEISNKKGLTYSGNAFEISLVYNRPATELNVRKIKCEIF